MTIRIGQRVSFHGYAGKVSSIFMENGFEKFAIRFDGDNVAAGWPVNVLSTSDIISSAGLGAEAIMKAACAFVVDDDTPEREAHVAMLEEHYPAIAMSPNQPSHRGRQR